MNDKQNSEQLQAVGIIGIVGMVGIVGIVGISFLTKGPAIRSFMGLVVIIEAHYICQTQEGPAYTRV